MYQVLGFLGFLWDVLKHCGCSNRIQGLVLPDKCGKSKMCSTYGGGTVLVDLDEICKESLNNVDKYHKALKRNDTTSMMLLLQDNVRELMTNLKSLHRFKKILLVSSRNDLLEVLSVNYKVLIPSTELFEKLKSGLHSDDVVIADRSRLQLLSSGHKHYIFNSFDELNSLVSNEYKLRRKL